MALDDMWLLTALAQGEAGLGDEAAGAGAVEGLLSPAKELDRGVGEDGLREVVDDVMFRVNRVLDSLVGAAACLAT